MLLQHLKKLNLLKSIIMLLFIFLKILLITMH